MNSQDRELRKGDFGYEDLTIGSSWAEIPKFRNLQSRTELRKLVKSKRFSCSRWLMNVVSFLEGLRA
jgi:hypothetical protein